MGGGVTNGSLGDREDGFFTSPLTFELFDRTAEQRHETALVINRARRAGVDVSDVEKRNRILFSDFYASVQKLVAEEAAVMYSSAQTHDVETVSDLARVSVLYQLEELHAVLPLPALDRLVPAA